MISGAYNLAACPSLGVSVSSILSQSLADFEFIICDDASRDGTFEILSEFARRDSRIKLIRNEENLGLAASLNRCLEISVGEYIARHDLDDVSDEKRLEAQVKFLDSNADISLVGTAAYLFDERGVFGMESFPERVLRRDFLFSSPYKHGSVVFRRCALIKAGGYRVAKETRRAEDYDLFMTMQGFCRGANLPDALYYFREDKNALSRRKYKYRIDEVKVRWRGFSRLGLLPRGFFYVIKPLIVGLIPTGLLAKLRRKRRNKYGRKASHGYRSDL